MRPRLAAALAVTLALAACGGEEEGSATMRPGANCLSCHAFGAAGTVYGRGDAAAGDGIAGVTVTLVGSGPGQTVTRTTNAAGNFYTTATLTPPLVVTLVAGGNTITVDHSGVAGADAPGAGGCASCHHPGGVKPRVHVGACADCHAP